MGLACYILYLEVSIFQKKELSQISHDKLLIPYYRQCIKTHSPFQSNGFTSKSGNVVSNDNKSCSNHQLSVPDLTWGWRLYLFLQGYVFIHVNEYRYGHRKVFVFMERKVEETCKNTWFVRIWRWGDILQLTKYKQVWKLGRSPYRRRLTAHPPPPWISAVIPDPVKGTKPSLWNQASILFDEPKCMISFCRGGHILIQIFSTQKNLKKITLTGY